MYFLSKCTLGKFQFQNLQMDQLNMMMILLVQFTLFFSIANAQAPSSNNIDEVESFHPSIAVVIGFLCIVFALAFVLVLYAKFRHQTSSGDNISPHIQNGLGRSSSRFSGIDKTVIESLPFFRFSSLKGSKEGLECAVCLSRFEDIEILRLLPKCKHAFHLNCIDLWLEKHSKCPLCRHKVSADDLSMLKDSTSLRFLWDQSNLTEGSNLELYVEREENRHGSSRFSIGSSFRKSGKGVKEEEVAIQKSRDMVVHKFNHKIIISDVVLMNNRWSNLSSSDLLFLSSEMLTDESSNRFASLDSNTKQASGSEVIKDGEIMSSEPRESSSKSVKILNPNEKRSMSEITVHPRCRESDDMKSKDDDEPSVTMRQERLRRLWLPIVRTTVERFGLSFPTQNTTPSLNL